MPYTRHDTPRTVARIERDLGLVRETVRRGDPRLRALVLTGGFARGEGTVLGGRPQNDYDLVAVRGIGPPRASYARMQDRLERRLGLHLDLCPVPAWRLRWAAPTIFWYETALRGRVLWGEDVLPRIPVRTPEDLDPTEGLRMLVNRAAGLLLATRSRDALHRRIQAAKALLAAADVHLLADGRFAPSQHERWERLRDLPAHTAAARAAAAMQPWLGWAYGFKVECDRTRPPDPGEAWRAAAEAVLGAVPAALRHAGLASLDDYARQDTLPGRLVYQARVGRVPGARRLVAHPTGRLRVATLRLLEASLGGEVPPEAARRWLGPLAAVGNEPMGLLDALRKATLQ